MVIDRGCCFVNELRRQEGKEGRSWRTWADSMCVFSRSKVGSESAQYDRKMTIAWCFVKKKPMVDFVMLETAKCLNCKRKVSEKTLVEAGM